MQFINKTTPNEEFYEMRKVILDSISENISSIAQLGKHGAINEADTTKMGYYVIKCLYKPYTLKKDQTTDGQVSREGGLSVKSDYLIIRGGGGELVLTTSHNKIECHNINPYYFSSMSRGVSYKECCIHYR